MVGILDRGPSILDELEEPSPLFPVDQQADLRFGSNIDELPEEKASKFRNFAEDIGAGQGTLVGFLSRAFGQSTGELRARRRAKLEAQVFEKKARDFLAAKPERRIETDVSGRKRFLDTGEPVFKDVGQKKPEFSNITESAPGKFTGFNKETGQLEEIPSSFLGQTFKQTEFADKKTERIFTRTSKLIDSAKKDKRIDNFIQVSSSLDRVNSASPTAAGDLSLVFSFMKMLDPGSVVREGEQALARNAAGVPERIRTTYNNLLAGESLAPAQRVDFKQQAGAVFDASKKTADIALQPILNRASKIKGLDVANIRNSIFGVPEADPTQGDIPTITTQAEFDALPKGATFIEDGRRLIKQ